MRRLLAAFSLPTPDSYPACARSEVRRHLATQQAACGSCLGVGVLRAKLTSMLSWLRSARSASITHGERHYGWPPGEGVLPRYAATGPVSAMPRHSPGNISRAGMISRLSSCNSGSRSSRNSKKCTWSLRPSQIPQASPAGNSGYAARPISVKRRITPAREAVAPQFPRHGGFRSVKRPGDGADRAAGRPHDRDLVSFLVQQM